MRIAFITDMHLGAEGEKPEGRDVRQNFLDALSLLNELKPNCLVLGGDFCLNVGERATYEWVKEQVDALSIPHYVIAGNHDDSTMLADVFRKKQELHDGELYYALPLEGRPTLFLDSSKGRFSEEQWAWLRDYFAALRDNNILVFMHHPPLPADVMYMDRNYAFQQSDEFIELVRELPCHVTVVCGHYHVEKVVQRGNLLVLLSPSTFFQMDQESSVFAIDNFQVGVRELNLTLHGTNSTVFYVDAYHKHP